MTWLDDFIDATFPIITWIAVAEIALYFALKLYNMHRRTKRRERRRRAVS